MRSGKQPSVARTDERPLPADRDRYGHSQAELLNALLRGEDYPPGFQVNDANAASRALINKRLRAVGQAWPALAHHLGENFSSAFEQFARTTPPPDSGGGLADGLTFAAAISRHALNDDARAELLLAHATITQRSTGPRPRRGPFIGATRLKHPSRLLIVLRLPRLGLRHVVVPNRHD